MRKLDLHIHTVSTISDVAFTFSMDILKRYIMERKIDAIAITNHNMFDLEQYRSITLTLSDTIVFPGIEVNIGNNAGHLLIIAKLDDVEDFFHKCQAIQNKIKSENDSIKIEELKKIFGGFDRYLLIPHYDKKPNVDKKILDEFKDYIFCGEVNSIKKFIYCQKDESALTPVYFSDFRAKENADIFPIRQTYFNMEEISLDAIKKCLLDKHKVSLSETEAHKKFSVLPELELSTGLNVIIGERSSGKTHTLNQIDKYFDNVKYIRQFELLETDPAKAAKEFTEKIAAKQRGIAKQFFEPFIKVVDDVKDISLENNEKQIDYFLTSLLKHASEIERADLFSKCSFFTENEFEINDLEGLKKLIDATELLLNTTEYKEIIEGIIQGEQLIDLYYALLQKYIKEQQKVLKKLWINDVIGNIKQRLQSKTASTRIADVNFYSIKMDSMKVKKFEEIVNNLKVEQNVYRKDLEGFRIEVNTKPYLGASSLKNRSKKHMSFTEAYRQYENPYAYLQKLKEIDKLEDTSYYEYFVDVEYRILNQFGYEVSGGERAEFNLLQEINDAYQYDMLLVDEPESSFDNIFLRNKVNQMLKEISKEMPVIIVTHNSTVGASIKPDFLIHTRRVINTNKEISYEIYYGNPSSKNLKSNDGKEIKNIQATMDCLEAGETAYLERGKEYEMLRD